MATQVAIRLGVEGKAEVKQGFTELARDGQAALGAVEQGTEKVGAAIDRNTARFKRMAEAARLAATAEEAQARFNSVLGVGGGSGKSASDSAAVFDADDRQAQQAAAIRAQLDPLRAAQDRYNDELERTQRLKTAGHLTDAEFIAYQNRLQVELDQTTAALNRNTNGLTRRQMAGRLNITRQIADIGVTGAMGMNPAMIAIQQGPQLLEAMSESGLKASSSMLLMGGALTAAAAGVVILGAAWMNGESEALKLDRAVTGLGRTSGLTAEHLDALARAGAEQGEVSIRSARDQAAAYVSTGKIGREVMVDLIAVGRDYASVFGLEAEDATQALAKAMAEPDKAARELTRQIGLMDQKTLDHIDTLVKLGREQEAQKILLDELTEAVKGHGDQISEVTNLWDAAGRAVSNYWEKLGNALYTTPDEALDRQIRTLEERVPRRAAQASFLTGHGLSGLAASPETLTADQQELERLRGIRNDQRADAMEADAVSARNQAAQEDRDRRDRAPKGRRDRSAERQAREALARQRQEEDRAFQIEMEMTRAIGDVDHVRALEEEEAIRSRIRQLVDDDVDAATARTTAMAEQARLNEARAIVTERETSRLFVANAVEVDRILGLQRSVALDERRADLDERINGYLKAGQGYYAAWLKAAQDQLLVEEARAEVMERQVDAAARDHRLNLARLRGDERAALALEYDQRVDERARDIEARLGMNYGEGVSAARRQIDEEIAAAATGARRSWLHGFAADIRQSGIKAALIEQFDTASDRFLRNLIDGLAAIDWSSVFGGTGAAGGFGKFLNVILGGGSGSSGKTGVGGGSKNADSGGFLGQILGVLRGVGGNADGTDDWPGGLSWVGERGRELVNLPRGSQVFSAPASLTMANRTAAAAPASISVPITIMAQDAQSFRASKSQIAAQIARAVRAAQRVD